MIEVCMLLYSPIPTAILNLLIPVLLKPTFEYQVSIEENVIPQPSVSYL